MLLKAFFEKIAGCHQTARLPKYSFQHYFFQEVDFVRDLQHKSRNVRLSMTRACLQVHWSKRPLNCQNYESD